MVADDFQVPPGYKVVYCKCYRHARTGKLVFRKDGGFFRFIVKDK